MEKRRRYPWTLLPSGVNVNNGFSNFFDSQIDKRELSILRLERTTVPVGDPSAFEKGGERNPAKNLKAWAEVWACIPQAFQVWFRVRFKFPR